MSITGSNTRTNTGTDTRIAGTGGDDHINPTGNGRRRRWWLWAAIGVVAIVALGYGAIFVYANVINDAPDALDEGDLASALDGAPPPPADSENAGGDAPAGDAVGSYGEPIEESADPAVAAPGPAAEAPLAELDGVWTPTAESEFGYRVDEVLAGVNTTAVGRSNDIDGALTIDGSSAEIEATVEVATIVSDDARRDGQFRGRIMDAASFPTATFTTTQPIDLGSVPADGEQLTAPVAGELTLKGSTQPVNFEVTAQRDGGRIGVLGSIPVLFADYGIENPSFGPVTTEDDGLVEFVLVFEQS